MLSFDDGTAGQAHEGSVQLTCSGMTGSFFVMTVVLNKPKWMSTRDILRLADAGMTIGSHTWDHHAVSDLSGNAWKVQLEQSRETLRKASRQPAPERAASLGHGTPDCRLVSTQSPHDRGANLRDASRCLGFRRRAFLIPLHGGNGQAPDELEHLVVVESLGRKSLGAFRVAREHVQPIAPTGEHDIGAQLRRLCTAR